MNARPVGKRTRNQIRRRKMAIQKLCGLVLIAVSIILVCVAVQGNATEGNDVTAVLLTAPLGLYLLFTRAIAIY